MNIPNLIGLIGALIAGFAYLQQIKRLIQEQCSAGISRSAFALWFASSILVTINAAYIHAAVFILLGLIQIASTGVIFIYSSKYRNQVCPFHTIPKPINQGK